MGGSEQKALRRGIAAGRLIGLAIGGIFALVIAMKPALFASLLG